jgi:hypothetical protein
VSTMSTEHRSLLMNANRRLGAALVDHNLVKIEDLEKANERLLEIVATNQPRQSTVLGILAYEMKVVREEDVLSHLVESESVGLVDLREYDVSEDLKKGMDRGAAWATWSVPFDQEEDFTFIATAYYLSPAVRNYWEKQFPGPVLWYGTTLESIADFLERADAESANTRSPFAAKTPVAAPKTGTTKPPFPSSTSKGSSTAKPFPAKVVSKAS